MSKSHALLTFIGRSLLAAIFIWSGLQKVLAYGETLAYMQAFGVPSLSLPVVILVELAGGVAILAGLLTRWAAIVLALFCLATAVVFHSDFADATQAVMFMKNLAIAGGLILLYANGPGAYAVRS
jgi:putative oxidoreductase